MTLRVVLCRLNLLRNRSQARHLDSSAFAISLSSLFAHPMANKSPKEQHWRSSGEKVTKRSVRKQTGNDKSLAQECLSQHGYGNDDDDDDDDDDEDDDD